DTCGQNVLGLPRLIRNQARSRLQHAALVVQGRLHPPTRRVMVVAVMEPQSRGRRPVPILDVIQAPLRLPEHRRLKWSVDAGHLLEQAPRRRRRVRRVRIPRRLPHDEFIERIPLPTKTPPVHHRDGPDRFLRGTIADSLTDVVDHFADAGDVVLDPLHRPRDRLLRGPAEQPGPLAVTDALSDLLLEVRERLREEVEGESPSASTATAPTRTILRVDMEVVIVSRCPPDGADAGEQ